MITEESFKGEVLAHLSRHYSIRLEIPAVKATHPNRISLRLYPSPLGEELRDNRYSVLIG